MSSILASRWNRPPDMIHSSPSSVWYTSILLTELIHIHTNLQSLATCGAGFGDGFVYITYHNVRILPLLVTSCLEHNQPISIPSNWRLPVVGRRVHCLYSRVRILFALRYYFPSDSRKCCLGFQSWLEHSFSPRQTNIRAMLGWNCAHSVMRLIYW